MDGAGLHMHGDELLDIFSILSWVKLLIERQSDVDDVRSIARSINNCFMIKKRGEFCFR